MCRSLLVALTGLLLASPRIHASVLPPQAYVWKNVVIKGGGFVSGLIYHPTARDVLYARTDVGGVFRWQASTNSWLPLTDFLGKDDSQLTGIVSVALDPRDPDRLYLACGQYLPSWAQHGAILRSSDRGSTWSRTNLSVNLGGNSDGRSTGERLQVDPNLGSVLFLGTNQDGLWKSTDSSATWNKVSSFPASSVTLVFFDPRTGAPGSATSTIYVGVNSVSSTSLYRSTDGGATWTAVAGQPSGLMPHHAVLSADGMLYVTFNDGLGPNGVGVGAVWKLKTADGTWTNVSPPLGQGGFAGISLDVLQPGTILVSTIDRWSPRDEIFRSTDGGVTWKGLNAISVRDTSSAPYAATSTPHWLGDIEIDPFNSNRAIYITGFGLFATDNLTAADTNGQVTWSFRNEGLEETVPLGFVSPPAGAPLVSVIGDIDGFRHDDLTVSPARGRLSPSVGTNRSIDFAELAPDIMVRTHGGGAARASLSADGGKTWTFFASAPAPATADNEGAIAVSSDGNRLVWAPTHAAAYYSSNGGASWAASSGGPAASANTSYVPVSDRVNPNKFYLYDATAGRVYVSVDGGATFTPGASGLPSGGNPLRAVFGKEGHLWLTVWNSGLYRSTDSGATFTKVAGVDEGNQIGFGQAAAGGVYPAIYLWGKISGTTAFYHSDDAGGTWARINDDVHQFGWINAITGDPRIYGRVYLATGGRGIVYGDVSSSPTITSAPQSHTAAVGSTVVFDVTGTGDNLTYQWSKGGTAIPGATSHLLVLSNSQAADAGNYTVSLTNSAGTVTSAAAVLAVVPTNDPGRLINVSVRTTTGTGNDVLIVGIVTGGAGTMGTKDLLIRGLGPRLADFGVPAILTDPIIQIIPQGSTTILAENNDWSGNAAVIATGALVGALPLTDSSSKDAALVSTLTSGAYSVKVIGANNTTGTALAEVYDAAPSSGGTTAPRLINISARAQMSNDNPIIAGFVIGGSTAMTVMIRGVGPSLAQYIGASAMVDPNIKAYVTRNGGNVLLTSNDDWGGSAQISSLAQRVGAFPLIDAASKDPVLVLTLDPGVYTAQVNGANNSSGIALLEVYAIP